MVSTDTRKKIDDQIQLNKFSYFGKEGYVSQFENLFARYLKIPYVLSLCSGTASLYIAFRALGFNSRAKVIVSTFSYPSVVTALLSINAEIFLCDSEANTGNIDLQSFKQIIQRERNIDGVVVTHLWGDPANIIELVKICKEKEIKVIEDCSHSFGAMVNKKYVGTFGDIACFSLQSNKAVFAGEGGVLATSNQLYFEKAVAYSMQKKRLLDNVFDQNLRKFWDSGLGLKLKIHPLGAIIAINSLREINEINKMRENNTVLLSKVIRSSRYITPPIVGCIGTTNRVYYTYKPLLDYELMSYKDTIVSRLIMKNLDVSSSSFYPIHYLPVYRHENVNKKTMFFPNAKKYFDRVLSLPSFTYEPQSLVKHYAVSLKNEVEKFVSGLGL